ncbi:MAG: carboxypeptidase-like regulatory domain-containing protein [Bryobacteraceae bacterium]|nr:carboxypeptidase-like regulatory domain-containing protein [Bryobacteraceae bacterium]
MAKLRLDFFLASGPAINLPSVEVNEDGSFDAGRLPPDTYRFVLSGDVGSAYLESVKVGDSVSHDSLLDLAAAGGNPVLLMLNTRGGEVSGTVQSARDDVPPPEGATVVLAPDPPNPERYELYRTATVDSQGLFQFKGVKPGKYRVYA